MFKVILIAALAISAVHAQESAAVSGEAAPEPYSYGYETDTHAASEQRDPNGRVTGFYTLADADGRQRRVEYYADESGFHAKVQTNEVGTKSENSADVEVLAAPPTQEQYVYRQQEQQVVQVPAQQRVVTQQVVAAPAKSSAVTYVQQQPRYAYTQGYTQGYSYNPSYYSYPVSYSVADSNQQYLTGNYGYGGYGAGYGAAYGGYNSYNNHLPSSYYRSLNTVQTAAPAVRTGYYQTSQVNTVPVAYNSVGNYQTVGVPAGGIRYQTVNAPAATVSYQTSSVPVTVNSPVGNLLQKRDSESAAAAAASEEK